MSSIAGYSVSSRLCLLIKRALDSSGCDSDAVIKKAGIDLDLISSPDARISATQFQKLWQIAVQVSEDPCFGIRVGEMVQPAALNGLGLSWIVSSNLLRSLQRLVKFQGAISTNLVLDLKLNDDGKCYTLSGQPKQLNYPYEIASIDVYLALVTKMCRLTFGEKLNPEKVLLRHQMPECLQRYRKFYAAPIEFNAHEYALIFKKSTLERLLPTSNPMLARINDKVVHDYLASLDQSDIILNLRTQIIDNLPAGQPSLESMAKNLNLSKRNLQRNLKNKNTSFRQQIQIVRHELALQYLKEDNRQVGEIAFLLGYTEPANFSRAFRDWTGVTPKAFDPH